MQSPASDGRLCARGLCAIHSPTGRTKPLTPIHRIRIRRVVLALLASVLAAPSAAQADVVVFPETKLFKPLLADPKRPRFFAGLTGLNMGPVDSTAALTGFGGQFGAVRWPNASGDGGWQVSLSAAAFAQFDVAEESAPLLNSDFIVGVPITYRSGPFSVRFRPYHQSSHLGDETQEMGRDRINFAFEAVESLVAWDFGPVRAYGGGELLITRDPENRDRGMIHTGADYRSSTPLTRAWGGTRLFPVAGVDVKFRQDHDWEPAIAASAGLQIHPESGPIAAERHYDILAVWHTGPSPFGQFFQADANFWGLTMEVSL